MTLVPLLSATPTIQLHAVAAMAAFCLGLVIIVRRKGTASHRLLGALWAGTMAVVALSSFWIHTIKQFGGYSLIHLLSVLTLVSLPYALWNVFHGRGRAHGRTMLALFFGALVIAGAFTLLPGRIMNQVVFGG